MAMTGKETDIVVFQQNCSGNQKIAGITRYGQGIRIRQVYNIDAALPDFIDDPETFITSSFTADLVLSFLRHPDLDHYLAALCQQKHIPLIASGRKIAGALGPFT